MPHPHDLFPSEFINQLKALLPEAEKSLDLARQQFDVAARAGIANAEMSKRLDEAQRKVAQIRAAFLI